MTRPTCAGSTTEPHCDRAVMRWRDGLGYCMWHPGEEPPALDPKTGRPIAATPPPRPKKPATTEAPAQYRAPGRVITAPRADTPPPPEDGLCPYCKGDARPYRHQGRHTKAKAIPAPREPRPPRPTKPTEQPPADGLCRTDRCRKTWKHRGAHSNPVDPVEAARRYQEGEGLFSLAADLHIGSRTLRELLLEQGVTLRKRGDVIGVRGQGPRPIDGQVCEQMYASGLNTTEIARQLQVRSTRVQQVLRDLGVLRPPGGRPPGAGALNSVRLKLTQDESRAVRVRAAELGVPINAYLRRLVLDDLGRDAQQEGAA